MRWVSLNMIRDKMLFELKRECLEVYRRKVDLANRCRAQLRQAIADAEADLAAICSSMGERPVHIRQAEQNVDSLKEELNTIHPQLEEMWKRKLDRKNQFLDVIGEIQKLSTEIYGSPGYDSTKSDRLKQVLENLNVMSSLCSVLGFDWKETVRELHPSLADSEENHSIATSTLQQMESAIKGLKELKCQRVQTLQDLATMLLELWNLMDAPVEEQQAFQNVTCNIAASEDEITDPNMLSTDFIKYGILYLEKLTRSKGSDRMSGYPRPGKTIPTRTERFPSILSLMPPSFLWSSLIPLPKGSWYLLLIVRVTISVVIKLVNCFLQQTPMVLAIPFRMYFKHQCLILMPIFKACMQAKF